MRRLLNAHGFSRVEAVEGRTRADLEVFIQAHGLPVMLKPVDGSASQGVSRIQSRAQIDAAWLTLRNVGRGRFIVEEYLEGPELSVESFSFGGRHVVLAVTQKSCSANFVEIGHALPAALLPDSIEEAVTASVRTFLDLVGLKDGPAHHGDQAHAARAAASCDGSHKPHRWG